MGVVSSTTFLYCSPIAVEATCQTLKNARHLQQQQPPRRRLRRSLDFKNTSSATNRIVTVQYFTLLVSISGSPSTTLPHQVRFVFSSEITTALPSLRLHILSSLDTALGNSPSMTTSYVWAHLILSLSRRGSMVHVMSLDRVPAGTSTYTVASLTVCARPVVVCFVSPPQRSSSLLLEVDAERRRREMGERSVLGQSSGEQETACIHTSCRV